MEATARVVVALGRLKGLFLEMPDARLSLAEASRVAGLESDVCQSILAALEDVRFIAREPDGCYRRRYVDIDAPREDCRPGARRPLRASVARLREHAQSA